MKNQQNRQLSDKEQRIESELTRLLFKNANVAIIGTLINTAMLTAVMWDIITSLTLLVWVTGVLCVTGLRYLLARRYYRETPSDAAIGPWRFRYVLGSASSGVLWGVAGALIVLNGELAHQALGAFILGGLSSGALAINAPVFLAFLLFVIPTLLPLSIMFLAAGDRFHLMMGTMVLVFFAVLMGGFREIASTLRQSLSYRFENDNLIHGLSTTKIELEGMNERLGMEINEHKRAQEALKESEMHFRRLFEDTDAISVQGYDMNRRVIYWNPASEKLYGYPADKAIGKKLEDLIIPDTMREPVIAAVTAWNDEGIAIPSSELTLRKADGSPVQVFSSHVMLLNKNNEREMYCIDVDLTERKQAEKEKERLQRELQQTHKMEALGQLTGGIAHDFNNILGIIMGYTGMALDRYGREVPDKVVDYLETAMKASERAKDLVTQMLTFSRSSNVDAQPLQFVPQIKENIKMLHSILPSSINIEFNNEDDLPSILMDPAKLQQLMMNLCVNARDAMEGVGTLTIDLGWHRGIDTECSTCHKWIKGDWIELSVADTGSGMTPEILERLFEPFYTTKEVGKGTGMGMAVLDGIVDSHGGHILVETELGKGSTFRLLFPPIIEETPERPEPDQSSDELPQGEGRHVLVVDDEPGLAEYIGDLLELYDYRATVITNSQEALGLFQENPDKFALLVTDQTMPRLTGMELINQLRELRPDFPVILCSGYSDSIDKDGAERRGISYLGKPIDSDRLIKSAGELLGLTVKQTV